MPYIDNGTAGTGFARANASTVINLYKDLNTPNWATAAGTSYFRVIIEFEIA
jgi:hypothetical protein